MNPNSISRSVSLKSLPSTASKAHIDPARIDGVQASTGEKPTDLVPAPDTPSLAIQQPVDLSAPSQEGLNDTLAGMAAHSHASQATDGAEAHSGPSDSITTFTQANDPRRLPDDTGSGPGVGEDAAPEPVVLKPVPTMKKDPPSLDVYVEPHGLASKQRVGPPQPFDAPAVLIDPPADLGAQALAKAKIEQSLDTGAFFKGMHTRLADLCKQYQIDSKEMAPLFNLFADAAMSSFRLAAEATHEVKGQPIAFDEPMVRKAMNLAHMANPSKEGEAPREGSETSFDPTSGSRSTKTSRKQIEQSLGRLPSHEKPRMERAARQAGDWVKAPVAREGHGVAPQRQRDVDPAGLRHRFATETRREAVNDGHEKAIAARDEEFAVGQTDLQRNQQALRRQREKNSGLMRDMFPDYPEA